MKGKLRPSPYRKAREELLSGRDATRIQALADLEAAIRADQRRIDAEQAQPEFPLPVRPDGSHHYVSTACTHGDHERCWRVCKFCPAECACDCGHPVASPATPEATPLPTQATPVSEPQFAEGNPVEMPVMDATGRTWLHGLPWPLQGPDIPLTSGDAADIAGGQS